MDDHKNIFSKIDSSIKTLKFKIIKNRGDILILEEAKRFISLLDRRYYYRIVFDDGEEMIIKFEGYEDCSIERPLKLCVYAMKNMNVTPNRAFNNYFNPLGIVSYDRFKRGDAGLISGYKWISEEYKRYAFKR